MTIVPRRAVLPGRVDVAIGKRAFKQMWVGATVCAVAFGATVASSALTYVSSFPTELSRQQIAATTGRDAGLAVLLGPVSSIGTVGGYTVYKVFVFLTTIGAIWALLAATRLLRGEEDAGRWQLMLSGSTRPARATAATFAALFAAVGVIFAGTTALTLLAARNPNVAFSVSGSLVFGLSIVIAPAVFVGVGGVASQLSRTRRGATGLGMAAFGVAFVLRMVADSGTRTRWLLWATPFGWTERMHPLTRNDVLPLLPAAVTVVGLVVATVALAARRDAGDGVLVSRDVAPLRPFGLGSAFGLTARRELPVLAAWCTGVFGLGVMFGVIAKVTTAATPGSIGDTLRKV
jgi:ABC-2 type transport system permease protein